jgi:hypothetical protein
VLTIGNQIGRADPIRYPEVRHINVTNSAPRKFDARLANVHMVIDVKYLLAIKRSELSIDTSRRSCAARVIGNEPLFGSFGETVVDALRRATKRV